MVLSMTGFGHAVGTVDDKRITIDVKSVNSKSCDLNLKTPFRYRSKDLEIRRILTDEIHRGKVDFYISTESLNGKTDTVLNQEVIKSYIRQLREISPVGIDTEFLKIAMTLPEALSTTDTEVSDAEWGKVKVLIQEAVRKLVEFRITEGKRLSKELEGYVQKIRENLAAVEPFEKSRMETVKERLLASLKEFKDLDENRYYQEVAYYQEKLDISEEKVRLSQHYNYYLEVLNNEEHQVGKKLGFIAQEMGREINTLGSKANHHQIQKLVVKMKDDLEKIKEQNLNVL